MRWMGLAIVLLVSCSERINPNICCATEERCAALGIDELRPCGAGQACGTENTCVAAECATNADCSDESPVCRLGFCESTCSQDADCAGVVGRTRCLEGACVGCVESSQCPMSAAICDTEEHACRGCELDNECASGVCIEIDGVCAEESRVIYAAGPGGVTTGECPRGAPCKLDYALTKTRVNRDVIHFTTGTATLPTTTSAFTSQVIIDGAPTMLTGVSGNPTFTVDPAGNLTLQKLILEAGFRVSSTGGTVRGFEVQGTAVQLTGNGGAITIRRSQLRMGSAITCIGPASLDVSLSMFETSGLELTGCTANITRNRFAMLDTYKPLDITNGTVLVENNLFTTTSELSDMVRFVGTVNSAFRFNTLVSVAATTDSAVALYCDASLSITSNIFAYNSTNPIHGNGPCTITSSLFDTQGATDAGSNAVGERSGFFVGAADFHLATGSPARDAGEPGLVDIDLEGTPRGAAPDIGAYEAP